MAVKTSKLEWFLFPRLRESVVQAIKVLQFEERYSRRFSLKAKWLITEQIAIWTNINLTLCSSILSSFATKWQQITAMQSHSNDVLNTVEEYFYLRFMLLHYLIASLKLINQYRLLQFSNPHLENLIKYCL